MTSRKTVGWDINQLSLAQVGAEMLALKSINSERGPAIQIYVFVFIGLYDHI